MDVRLLPQLLERLRKEFKDSLRNTESDSQTKATSHCAPSTAWPLRGGAESTASVLRLALVPGYFRE